MRKMLLFVFVILFYAGTSNAQWTVYDCSVLPAEADTAWHEGGDEPDEIPSLVSLVDDPDVPGNMLLMVDENQGAAKETWTYQWNADPDVGVTFVFRVKAMDPGKYSRDWDMYIQNGMVRERFVSNGGGEIKFDKSKMSTQITTTEWHVYRITLIGDYFEVYVDEDPLSYLSAQGDASDGNFIQFGDNGSNSIGCLFDWFAWDLSGAYPPETGTPLPGGLAGITTSVEKTEKLNAMDFELHQNYPNPFNPVTEIEFTMPEADLVTLQVFDVKGRLVKTLINETKQAGAYKLQWDGCDQLHNAEPSGIYFYSIKTSSFKSTRKMSLIK